jgi:hypothetical protein
MVIEPLTIREVLDEKFRTTRLLSSSSIWSLRQAQQIVD